MINLQSLRLDLGFRSLLPQWRLLAGPKHWREDIFAGITLALVAVPLSLAIALASGVEPAVGIITAIIAGIVCALFGGNPISVSGPAAAMAVIVALAVEQYGLAGLLIIGLICGLLQILTGVFGFGRFVRLMPIPVIEGFTAGIGAIILIAQLPRALGLPPPSESHVIDVITHIGNLISESQAESVIIAASVIFLLWATPRISSKLPGPLIGIALPSLAAYYFGSAGLARIGEIPRAFPIPKFPVLPEGIDLLQLLGTALLVYALASLETLLSSTAVDKLVKGARSDLDQELIGQGLGNLAVAMFGGIPVTGVIVRSATNVIAGAKTRRSSIIHSLLLIGTVLLFAPLIGQIPIAALAGLLLFIAARMVNPEKLINLYHVSRSDALVYAITLSVIVFVDLLEGVQWGLVGALAILAFQIGRTNIKIYGSGTGGEGPYRFELQGPITFLSSLKIDELKSKIGGLDPSRGVAIDMQGVTEIDGSGAEMLFEVVEDLRGRNIKLAISGLPEKERKFLVMADANHKLDHMIASTEQELLEILGGRVPSDPAERLDKGLQRFLQEERHRYQKLFGKLAQGQSPHTLFITCSDSRIQPNLMTSTDPGELFIVRNVGNMIPRVQPGSVFAEAAAVDFAVGILGVKEIVVCGHSSCGAMMALHGNKEVPANLKNLEAWRKETMENESYHPIPSEIGLDEVARINALYQLDNLRSYSIVRDLEASGDLQLHAWFFEIKNGEIEIWSPEHKRYIKQSSLTNQQMHHSPMMVL
ncbi:MAG: bifunctional SulP family inorganic anion transporter/carbonic anhydrase [Myxococcota bacterium]